MTFVWVELEGFGTFPLKETFGGVLPPVGATFQWQGWTLRVMECHIDYGDLTTVRVKVTPGPIAVA